MSPRSGTLRVPLVDGFGQPAAYPLALSNYHVGFRESALRGVVANGVTRQTEPIGYVLQGEVCEASHFGLIPYVACVVHLPK